MITTPRTTGRRVKSFVLSTGITPVRVVVLSVDEQTIRDVFSYSQLLGPLDLVLRQKCAVNYLHSGRRL
jgi:hypothetical protein